MDFRTPLNLGRHFKGVQSLKQSLPARPCGNTNVGRGLVPRLDKFVKLARRYVNTPTVRRRTEADYPNNLAASPGRINIECSFTAPVVRAFVSGCTWVELCM